MSALDGIYEIEYVYLTKFPPKKFILVPKVCFCLVHHLNRVKKIFIIREISKQTVFANKKKTNKEKERGFF